MSRLSLTRSGLWGGSQTLDCSCVGQPHLGVTLRARLEEEEAKPGTGLHPKPGGGTRAEPGTARQEAQLVPRSCPAASLPLGSPSCSLYSFPTTPSCRKWPRVPFLGDFLFSRLLEHRAFLRAAGPCSLLRPAPLTVSAAPATRRRCRSRGCAPRACPCSRRSPSSRRRRCCS